MDEPAKRVQADQSGRVSAMQFEPWRLAPGKAGIRPFVQFPQICPSVLGKLEGVVLSCRNQFADVLGHALARHSQLNIIQPVCKFVISYSEIDNLVHRKHSAAALHYCISSQYERQVHAGNPESIIAPLE
jgi:hypothetical protein